MGDNNITDGPLDSDIRTEERDNWTPTFEKGNDLPEGSKFYIKTTTVEMVKMDKLFRAVSREGVLFGEAGDFLVEDGYGGFYSVGADFHEANYVEVVDD